MYLSDRSHRYFHIFPQPLIKHRKSVLKSSQVSVCQQANTRYKTGEVTCSCCQSINRLCVSVPSAGAEEKLLPITAFVCSRSSRH